MKKLVLSIISFIFLSSVFGQGWRPGEMEVKVQINSKADALKLHALKLDGDLFADGALMYVTPDELQQIDAAGLSYRITIADMNAHYRDFWQTDEAYHSYEDIIALADSLADNFPDICERRMFGTSLGGRQLSALKISDNVSVDENEAEVMFDGGIHGDEIGGAENIIRFARDLCLGYGNNTQITELIDNREIWLYLMVNPDGRANMSRTNNNGVDLNRDWGYMWDEWGGSTGAYSQVESRALRACSFSNQFVVHTTYHSGTEMISYPWSYRPNPAPDHAQIDQLAALYSTTSGYSNLDYGQGYSGMYAINGSTKDANYGIMGSISWSIEISYDKQPPASQIMTYYNNNKPSMLMLIEYAGYGLEGTVTDATTGDPVAAVIFTDDYLPTYTDPEVGDYHKYVLEGTYDILVKANGYADKLITGVSVSEMSSTVTNIQLDPLDHQGVYRFVSSQIQDNNPADEGHTWNVIGQPDNLNYSLGKAGWAVLDMQEVIFDGAGPDIMVFEGDASAEGYTLYAGETMDGPWHEMGTGTGTAEFDFATCSISEARYLKIVDDGDGSANVNDAGFDLDAIQALSSVTGPYIIMEGYVVDDANGNNNGQLDPGETADFIITLKNVGTEQAQAITGSLSTGDPYLTVITTQAQDFGNIGVDETASATFTVSAEASAPAGHTSTLDFQYQGTNVDPNTKYIDVVFPDYCYPSANCSYGDGLTGFALEDIQNMDNGCSPDGFGDFTDMSTQLEAGGTYTVSLKTGYDDQNVSLWIDLNANMEFEESERLISDFNLASSGQVYTADITLPTGITPGEKRLRVRAHWQETSLEPCDSYSYGETEDYTVVFAGGNPLNAAFTSDVNEICQGDQVHYYDNSTGDITSWEWEFPGGTPATSTEQNPVVVYDTPGNYGVTLTIGDGTNTSTASELEYMIVHEDPQTPETPEGLTEMCMDAPNCNYTTTAANATDWVWEMTPESAGTMYPDGPVVEIDWNPDFTGSVQLQVACANMCGQSSMSDPLDITVKPYPGAAGIVSGQDTVCQQDVIVYNIDAISDATTYEWMIDPENAGTLNVEQNQCTVTFGDIYEGVASLKVRGVNDCGEGDWSESFDIVIENCTGIHDPIPANSVSIFPNPSNGLMTLKLNADLDKNSSITISSVTGVTIFSKSLNKTNRGDQLEIDLGNLSDGLYFLKLETSSGTLMKKIMIRQ